MARTARALYDFVETRAIEPGRMAQRITDVQDKIEEMRKVRLEIEESLQIRRLESIDPQTVLDYVKDGSLSNSVEIATRWHKPQKHLSPVNLHISQTVGDTLQHLNLGITPLGKAISSPVVKVV